MKKVVTIRSMLFNSFIVVIFAACGANAHKKTEICSKIESDMFLPQNNSAINKTEENSDPMILPKNPNFDKESHPMVVSPCAKPKEKELGVGNYEL